MRFFAVLVFAAIGMFSNGKADAGTITVEVLDTTRISVSFSGSMPLSSPDTFGNTIFIDVPVAETVTSGFLSISGDLAVGGAPIFEAYSGYNNDPYGGTLQLRRAVGPLFVAGSAMTGTGTIQFRYAHGLTQSMFDAGVTAYWGRMQYTTGAFPTGPVIGRAVSPNNTPAVPLPAGLPLLVGALGAFGILRRRRPV